MGTYNTKDLKTIAPVLSILGCIFRARHPQKVVSTCPPARRLTSGCPPKWLPYKNLKQDIYVYHFSHGPVTVPSRSRHGVFSDSLNFK